MPQVTYNGQPQDFKVPFWDYGKVREGYRLVVYKDNKGLPTVGIGHLVTDGTAVGTKLTEAQVQDLFNQDYDSLNIEQYVSENPAYSLNQMLCIAHFIWMHGAAAYDSSNYRTYFQEVTADAPFGTSMPDEASMQAYLAANWDLSNPGDQRENKDDCHVAYSATDWSPGF